MIWCLCSVEAVQSSSVRNHLKVKKKTIEMTSKLSSYTTKSSTLINIHHHTKAFIYLLTQLHRALYTMLVYFYKLLICKFRFHPVTHFRKFKREKITTPEMKQEPKHIKPIYLSSQISPSSSHIS